MPEPYSNKNSIGGSKQSCLMGLCVPCGAMLVDPPRNPALRAAPSPRTEYVLSVTPPVRGRRGLPYTRNTPGNRQHADMPVDTDEHTLDMENRTDRADFRALLQDDLASLRLRGEVSSRE